MKLFSGGYTPQMFSRDFLASIVVFLVAMPLCLGIALASGVPPAMGLVTAIIGGIVVGLLAGCPLQASGPAAGLVAIIWEVVQKHGLEGLSVIVLLAGGLQILAGVLKLGHWFRAVSPAVIHGMLAGIGVLIFAGQFHVMVDDAPKNSDIANLLSIPQSIYKGIFPLDGSTHHLAASIGLLTIVLIVIWNFMPKKIKVVPGALIAVIVATLAADIFKLPINYVQIPDNLLGSLQFLSWENFTGSVGNTGIWLTAASIAFIASAETMLTATAISQMKSSMKANYNREMVAQGVGNMLCGFVGALPMTGVIVRSAANVEAGAVSRLSTMLHGFWILVLVALAPFVIKLIPTASLAAILVYTGYKLVNVATMKKLLAIGKSELAIYAITLVAIVATNLLEGVIIGFGLSLLKLLYSYSFLKIVYLREPETDKAIIHLSGSANFINLPRLAEQLESLPQGLEVHLRLDQLNTIDHACLELIRNWEKQYESTGGTVSVEWSELMAKTHQRYTPGGSATKVI